MWPPPWLFFLVFLRASINRFTISDYELPLQEELGIEYDEDVGVSFQSFSDLVQHADKRRRFK
ncbi:hypothetical protein LINGRAHAP2_LOCUS36769 [Linum grandiflorum]